MRETTTTAPPLADYRVIGLRENWYQAAPDAPKLPGGSCWHCGTGIAIEVVIRSKVTGETHVIGTTCAERVGLNGPELKAMLAERFAEQREARRIANSAAARKARAEAEAAATAEHGSHGTASRFLSGCYCDPCHKAAPHGTLTRFVLGCHCLECIDGVATSRPDEYGYWDRPVLVDLETGQVADARQVDTRYGRSWCIDNGAAWVSCNPKRRSTLTNKGYTEAEAPFFGEWRGSRSRRWFEPIVRVGSPIFDRFDEPIREDSQ